MSLDTEDFTTLVSYINKNPDKGLSRVRYTTGDIIYVRGVAVLVRSLRYGAESEIEMPIKEVEPFLRKIIKIEKEAVEKRKQEEERKRAKKLAKDMDIVLSFFNSADKEF